jgi:hypothetical protein
MLSIGYKDNWTIVAAEIPAANAGILSDHRPLAPVTGANIHADSTLPHSSGGVSVDPVLGWSRFLSAKVHGSAGGFIYDLRFTIYGRHANGSLQTRRRSIWRFTPVDRAIRRKDQVSCASVRPRSTFGLGHYGPLELPRYAFNAVWLEILGSRGLI